MSDDWTLDRIAQEEAFRDKMYHDSRGFTTIGYGFNLDAGMSEEEARDLLQLRLRHAREALTANLPCYAALDDVRKSVLDDMCYNLGWGKLRLFTQTFAAVSRGDYAAAATAMQASKWFKQVGIRGRTLVAMMASGQRQ